MLSKAANTISLDLVYEMGLFEVLKIYVSDFFK